MSSELRALDIEDCQLIKKVMLNKEKIPGIKYTKPNIDITHLREESIVIAIPNTQLDKIVSIYK